MWIIFFVLLLFLFLNKYFFFNKNLLWTNFSQNTFFNKVFPYTYDTEYFRALDQQKPIIFFAKYWENYMNYCHKNLKLCTFLPYQQVVWNLIWLRNIQYVWRNVSSVYNSWLYESLDNLTSISPYREYPYTFGQYLLPIQKNTEKIDENLKKLSWTETLGIWEKWIKYLCDEDKINKISKLNEKDFLDEYQNKNLNIWNLSDPCKSYILPHSLGFNYYFLTDNLNNSIKYYKVASLSKNAPEISYQMPAIIAWKLGEHEKSVSLWYERYFETYKLLWKSKNNKEKENLTRQTGLTKDMEKYLKKALMEFTIQLIIDAEEWQKECLHDLDCLRKNWYLQEKIKKKSESCFVLKKSELTKNINCQVLKYWIENKYIKSDWKLIYPLEEWFVYWRRPDHNQRRILPQINTD